MKNAAKCDTQCELQNSVNHQTFERILRLDVFILAYLFQWLLPLSPTGLLDPAGRQDSSLSQALSLIEAFCVAPGAEVVAPIGSLGVRLSSLALDRRAPLGAEQRGSRALPLPIADSQSSAGSLGPP